MPCRDWIPLPGRETEPPPEYLNPNPSKKKKGKDMPCRDQGYTLEQELYGKFNKLSEYIDFIDSQLGIRIYDYRGLAVNQAVIDLMTLKLCEAIRGMTPNQQDVTVYNGRFKIAREMADWWEEHQTLDAIRASQELAIAQLSPTERRDIVNQAQWKITPDEWVAIVYAVKHGEID